MASIVNRSGRYSVVYYFKDINGVRKQRWEVQENLSVAKQRKKEIENQLSNGSMILSANLILRDFLDDFVKLYGSRKWSLSTFSSNMSIINRYINPIIGKHKLTDINTYIIDEYYNFLLKNGENIVSVGIIYEIHKLLRCAFNQAIRWGYISQNPIQNATLPAKQKSEVKFWNEEEITTALEQCTDLVLRLCIHLAFAGTMRIGEILALTWDDISDDGKEVCINKTLMRADMNIVKQLSGKDILFIFPPQYRKAHTSLVLKRPKTESSNRTVYLPDTVAKYLLALHREQLKATDKKEINYEDYNLVLVQTDGRPYTDAIINNHFHQLIKETGLPTVLFHSLRHSSITFKLKLTGGNIKCVQGDSGHSQSTMVTDLYAHSCDADRKQSSELFNEVFYQVKNSGTSDGEDAKIKEVVQAVKKHPEFLKILQNLLINL